MDSTVICAMQCSWDGKRSYQPVSNKDGRVHGPQQRPPLPAVLAPHPLNLSRRLALPTGGHGGGQARFCLLRTPSPKNVHRKQHDALMRARGPSDPRISGRPSFVWLLLSEFSTSVRGDFLLSSCFCVRCAPGLYHKLIKHGRGMW